MVLKNIFSTKDKKDKDGDSLKSNKSGRRESTNPIARTLSNWSHHKDKNRSKYSSLSSKNASGSLSLSAHDIKRLSEPFPPAVPSISVSHQLPPTRGNKVTQNYDKQQKTVQQQQQRQMNTTNPFATTARASPITPSGSIRDVNNVVHVLRDSMSSGASLSTFASAIDEEKHTQYNTSHDSLDATIPIATKEQVDTNPFLQSGHAAAEQNVVYPPPMRVDNDSNKYELSENEYHAIEPFNCDAPMTPPDSAKSEIHDQDYGDESLYSELLAIQRQLNAANPNNAVDIRNRLDGVNQLLTRALDNSSHLETRLKSVMHTSKQTIIAINEENKALRSLDETTKVELEQTKQWLEEMKEKHQGQLMVYQDLKDQHDSVMKENQELLQKTQELSTRLDQQIATRQNISLLLNNGKKADQEGDDDLQEKLKNIIAQSASSQLLNKQLKDELQTMTTRHAQELEALKQSFEAVEQRHLQSKKQELAAKDQQLTSKHQELLDLQTKLETEKTQALASKHQEFLSLQSKMDADAKAHQAEIQALEQEQKTLMAQLETESAALETKNQAEIQGLQDTLEQEQQQKLKALQKTIQDLKSKAGVDIATLEEEKNRFKSQIDILKSHTSDSVQKVAQDNITLKQGLDKVEKEKEGLEKQQVAMAAALASTKEENSGLQSKVSNLQLSDKVLKERLAEAQQQNETQVLECHQLRRQLAEMEHMSREAAKSVMDENERLGQQMEDNALASSSTRTTIVTENQQLKNELKAMNSVQQENLNLTELVECLQTKLNALSAQDDAAAGGVRDKKDSQQEELMLMHTKAQLGLIEYLEGEDDVLLAMSKFKKQLEMK